MAWSPWDAGSVVMCIESVREMGMCARNLGFQTLSVKGMYMCLLHKLHSVVFFFFAASFSVAVLYYNRLLWLTCTSFISVKCKETGQSPETGHWDTYVHPTYCILFILRLCGFCCVHSCMAVYITDSEEGSWYPREKLKQAEKKLQGYNSAHVMR